MNRILFRGAPDVDVRLLQQPEKLAAILKSGLKHKLDHTILERRHARAAE